MLSASNALGVPDGLVVGKQYVMVCDTKSVHPILIFDRESGELIASVGTRGDGPGEISNVFALDFKPGSNSGWVFDFTSRVLHFLDLDALIRTREITGQRVQLQGLGAPLSPVWIDRERIASTGLYSEGKLAIYESDGAFSRFLGHTPPGPVTTPVNVRQYAYASTLRTNSDGTRIAAAAQHTD